MKIEKGKWYHADGILIYVNKLYGDAVFGYGLNSEEGFWIEEDDDPWYVMQITREATPQEVESALIEEAKRRGFDFEKYQYSETLENEVNEIKLWGHYINPPYKYTEVFKDGKWAEVIKNDDKFAELKEAHKNGAVIQWRREKIDGRCVWKDCHENDPPTWRHFNEYRIKPEEEDPYNWVNNNLSKDKIQLFSGGMNTDEVINTQPHYDNTHGSLYQIAEQRGWNSYQFDIIKRIDRSLKKGQFKDDLKKTKDLIDLWLREYEN